MVGNFNTKSLVPKLAIMMLTDLTNIPADFTQETSLNGKYLKGISTALTDPDVNTGNANHTHSPDGNHVHTATVGSHSHTGTSNTGPNAAVQSTPSVLAPLNHTHPTSTDSKALAEASNDGDHTHNAFTNDLEHRTITFYKKTNTVIHMSRKSLPRNMTFFIQKLARYQQGFWRISIMVENTLRVMSHLALRLVLTYTNMIARCITTQLIFQITNM